MESKSGPVKELQFLNWDSDFFGKKIYRLQLISYPAECMKEVEDILGNVDFDLCYLEYPSESKGYEVKILGTDPIDYKRIYCKEIKATEDGTPTDNIREIDTADEALYRLALEAGYESRYRRDDCFSRDEFVRLYKTWVDNSLNKTIADKVFGYYDANKLKGFITVSFRDGEAVIGLIAVDPAVRNKGVGRSLIKKVYMEAKKHNCKILKVATQRLNESACRFYERTGFRLKSETIIHHIWK